MKDIVVRLSDGADIALRRAESKDLPSIVDLLADDPLGSTREGADTGYGPYECAFEDISADPRQLLVVAVNEQEIVGTLQLTVIPGLSRRGARRAQIEGVRVSRRYRSRGLGAAMIQWAIGESAARQCALVQLTSDKSRVDAHRFYERLGFAATHEGFKMSLNGQATIAGRR
jgi:ribosomal protein S18 acetylase RimI-like enzyme